MDPARFWDITPRLMSLEVAGAQIRIKRDRELTWFAAMLPHLEKKPTLPQFLGEKPDEATRIREFHEAWDKVDRGLRH